MKKSLLLVVLLAIVAAPAAFAETFTLSQYGVSSSLNTSPYSSTCGAASNGLGICVQDIAPQTGLTKNLNVGDSWTFDLFKIWTNEKTIEQRDDPRSNDIKVAFTFNPPSSKQGTVEGTTDAVHDVFLAGYVWIFPDYDADNYGEVKWDGPAVVNFGNSGQYTVTLSNAKFNEHMDGDDDSTQLDVDKKGGEKHAATVQATVTYNSSPVPEPGTLAMMGSGLLGLGGMIRRKFGR